MAQEEFVKDPSAVLDYVINWSTWLGSDTITGTPTWTVPTGITKDSQSNSTTAATIWLRVSEEQNSPTAANRALTRMTPR